MTRRTQTRNYYTVTVTALHIRHEVRVHDVGRIMISVFSGPGCLGAPTCDPMGLLAPPSGLRTGQAEIRGQAVQWRLPL